MTGTLIQMTAIKDILSGIFLCLLIITVMYTMPLIGVFAWLFLPLPVLFYRLKTGRNGSVIIMMTSMIVLIVFTSGFAFNTLYFGSLLVTGFFLGEFIEKHLSIEKIMLYTVFTVIGTCAAVLLIYFFTQPVGIEQLISTYVSRYNALSSDLFSQSAQLYPDMEMNRQMLKKISSLFVIAFPGIFINSYLTMIWLNILLMKKLLIKKGITVKSIENLKQWKAPDCLIFAVITALIFMFLPVDILKYIAVNSLIILMFVYFAQGIAVVSFFFQKKNAPFVLQIFFYTLIAIQPFFMLLVIGCGLFDTWINFRKLDPALR